MQECEGAIHFGRELGILVNPHRDMIVVHEIERLRVSHLHLYRKRTYRTLLVLQFGLYVCNIGVSLSDIFGELIHHGHKVFGLVAIGVV